jgi:hypothetical protein
MAKKAFHQRLIIYLYNRYVPSEIVNSENENQSPQGVEVRITDFTNDWNKFALELANKDRSER